MWLAELHFATRSVLASPMPIAAAIAARTERIKIGTAVQVLPLGHPLRLAEEWATVDQISQGRLIFGVGRSGFARTYNAYGIPYAESRERFAEALDDHHEGLDRADILVRGRVLQLRQRQHDPEAVPAAASADPRRRHHPDTFPALGTQGYPLFAAVRLGTISDLVPDLEAYRAAYARPATRARARCSCASRSTSPTRPSRRSSSPSRA